jgi:hypothetical protein
MRDLNMLGVVGREVNKASHYSYWVAIMDQVHKANFTELEFGSRDISIRNTVVQVETRGLGIKLEISQIFVTILFGFAKCVYDTHATTMTQV